MNQFHRNHLKPWGLALVEKYPLIFLDNPSLCTSLKADPSNFVSLRYGFEHGEGWAGLIEKIAKVGTELVTHLRANGYPDASIHSFICKEKFGGLRWQGDQNLAGPFFNVWRSYVGDIEQQSYHICEVTGKYGQLCRKESGWVRTLCTEQANLLGFTPCNQVETQ